MDGDVTLGLLCLGVFSLPIIIIVGLHLCTLMCMPEVIASPSVQRAPQDQRLNGMERGLNEATVHSYPKLLYSQFKLQNGNSVGSSCSVCLADYKDTDMLRKLPLCAHVFHAKCVDPWLRMHASCPICRNSPLRTSVAEETPLTASQHWQHKQR